MKMLYFSFARANASIDGIYINGLRKNGVGVINYSFHGLGGIRRYLKIAKCYSIHREAVDFIMVGYDSPLLVIFIWMISRKRIIYNALCSVYERLIISRALAKEKSVKAYYYWFLDYLACHLANLVLVETNEQIKYFIKQFKIPASKLFRALIGVDDDKFLYRDNVKKYENFTVLFRGRLLPEAGGEFVVEAAKLLENSPIQFIMIANGMWLNKIQNRINELGVKNLKLISDFVPDEELCDYMQKSHLSLGQLSSHPRLERTIPHKAYESLALKLPYLTARSKGALELLKEGETCIVANQADAKNLAEKILWAYNNQKEIEKIAENGYKFFLENCTSKKLARDLLERLTINPVTFQRGIRPRRND